MYHANNMRNECRVNNGIHQSTMILISKTISVPRYCHSHMSEFYTKYRKHTEMCHYLYNRVIRLWPVSTNIISFKQRALVFIGAVSMKSTWLLGNAIYMIPVFYFHHLFNTHLRWLLCDGKMSSIRSRVVLPAQVSRSEVRDVSWITSSRAKVSTSSSACVRSRLDRRW